MADKSQLIDHPSEPDKPRTVWYYLSLYGPLILVVAGIIVQWNHLPMGELLTMTGILWSVIRMSVRFFRKARKAYEWCYYLGNLSLLAVLIGTAGIIHFIGPFFMVIPAVFFLAGIILTSNSREENEPLDSSMD